MDKKTCKHCAHYRQHYTFDKRKIFRVFCGHCTFQKPRTKRPDTAACENFVFAPPDEEAFASKEYLSKELLQYVLQLDRLPPVEDTADYPK